VVLAAFLLVAIMLAMAAVALRRQYIAMALLRLQPSHEHVFRAENQAVAKSMPLRIVVFGDSRVARWHPVPDLHEAEWLWRGIAGETTAQMMLRFQKDVLDLTPDITIILGGINDLTCGVAVGKQREAISSATENLSRMISLASDAGIRVIVLNVVRPARPPPWRWVVWSRSFPDLVDEFNAQLRPLATSDARILEIDALLANGSTYLPARFAASTLHFTPDAYEVMNASVVSEVKALINAVQ
jgi:acyl-CoA thioesterase I